MTTPRPDDPTGHEETDQPDRPLVGGRYRLDDDSPLGSGATGKVWRATDTLLGRVVALKQVRITGPDQHTVEEVRERTLHEASIATQLHHPNVVTVFDVIVADDQLWLVLEYVPSRSADKLLDADGPLPHHQVARIGAQIAEALAAAHATGIRHRDVKPGSILVDPTGRAKLTDFGISPSVSDLRLSATEMTTGTPAYLAPEVARGEELTNAADVYSLGATLYTLVEGTPPFGTGDPNNPLQLLRRVASEAMTPPSHAGPLTDALTRLTDPDPHRRPDAATAHQLLAVLTQDTLTQDTLTQGSGAPTRTSPEPSPNLVDPRPARRRWFTRPTVLAPLALLLAALAIAAIMLLPHLRHTPPAPPAAAGKNYVPDPQRADPCALLNPSDFNGFGSTQRYLGKYFNSCYVEITLSGGGTADVSVYLILRQPHFGSAERRGDLTIFRPDQSASECLRMVALPDGTTINIDALLSNSTISPCPLADTATDTVLRDISSGSVPELSTAGDPNSLRRQNTCQLLDSSDLQAAPSVESTKVYPEFANWTCDWGNDADTPNFGPPAVQLYFSRVLPLSAGQDGTSEKIADRDVFVKPQVGANDQAECLVQVVHRHTTDDSGTPVEEVVNVGVYAAVPYDQQCAMARKLAASAIAKLPPP
jgi:serine/threonine protein kinase